MTDMWLIEDSFYEQGYQTICGVDEAGRGPLAGPVCAAAVILPKHLELPGLTDSKKLTDKKRRELYPIIKEQAIAYGIGFASEQEIDEINILQATFLAMQRAIDQLNGKREPSAISVTPPMTDGSHSFVKTAVLPVSADSFAESLSICAAVMGTAVLATARKMPRLSSKHSP